MVQQNEDNNDGNNSNREEKEGQFSKAGRSGTNRKFTEYSEEELRAQKAFVQGDSGKVSTAKRRGNRSSEPRELVCWTRCKSARIAKRCSIATLF